MSIGFLLSSSIFFIFSPDLLLWFASSFGLNTGSENFLFELVSSDLFAVCNLKFDLSIISFEFFKESEFLFGWSDENVPVSRFLFCWSDEFVPLSEFLFGLSDEFLPVSDSLFGWLDEFLPVSLLLELKPFLLEKGFFKVLFSFFFPFSLFM